MQPLHCHDLLASAFNFPWFKSGNSRLPPPPPRIGLALSCGGARGLAHIGVIQVLERACVPISAIIGSSMGAYIGALWAAGVDGAGLEELAGEIKDRRALLRLLDPVLPPSTGFIHGRKFRAHYERSMAGRTLRDLHPDMFVTATNLDTLAYEVFPQDTPVADAVHASSAIPGMVAPVTLAGKRYIDGGASQPLPVSLLRKLRQLDFVVGVNVMPTIRDIAAFPPGSFPAQPDVPANPLRRAWSTLMKPLNLFAYGNVLDTFKRCLTAAQLRLISEESDAADVLIHPFLSESKWYDFENFARYIHAGRCAAESALPQIEKLMARSSSTPLCHDNLPPQPAVGCRVA